MARNLLVFIPCFTLTLLIFVHFTKAGVESLSKNKSSKSQGETQSEIIVESQTNTKAMENIESKSREKIPKKISRSNTKRLRRKTGRQQKSLGDLAASDPFSKGATGSANSPVVNGQQLTCAAAGIPCTSNCGFLDWWTERNRSIGVPPYKESTANSPADCFSLCQAAALHCTAFVYNPTTKNCSIFSSFVYSDMVPLAGFSLNIRLGPLPPPLILGEWILSRDRQPYYNAFQTIDLSPKNPTYAHVTTSWVTCLELCSFSDNTKKSTLPTCLAATFDLTSKICRLHDSFDSTAQVQPQIVAMTHISVFPNGDNLGPNGYRFTQLNHVTPANDPKLTLSPTISYSVDTVNECLDTCMDLGWNCTLAAVSYGGDDPTDQDDDVSFISCNLYQDVPVTFNLDPNSQNQSYIFSVQPQNSLIRKMFSFAQVKGKPLTVLPAAGFNECLGLALDFPSGNSTPTSKQWWYLNYDSTLALCTLYSQTIDGLQIDPNPSTSSTTTRQTSVTFLKSIPTHNPDFYSFDSIWVDASQVSFPQGAPSFSNSGPQSSPLDTCLATCINLTSSDASTTCPGVIYRPSDHQCAILNTAQMLAISNRNQSTASSAPSLLSWQVFIKTRDLTFLQSKDTTKGVYTCMNTSVYDEKFSAVNRSNPLVGHDELEQFEESLGNNTGQWIEPHGANFGGTPQFGLQAPAQIAISNGHVGAAAPLSARFPPASSKQGNTYRNLDTVPTSLTKGNFLESIIGSAATAGAIAAAIGAVLGNLPGAGAGWLIGNIVGGVIGFLTCLAGHCKTPNPKELTCEVACELGSKSTEFLSTLREIAEISRIRHAAMTASPKLGLSWSAEPTLLLQPNAEVEKDREHFYNMSANFGPPIIERVGKCKCKNTPYPIGGTGALKIPDFVNRALQRDCDGTPLQGTCEICCQTGYESTDDPTCECENGKAVWNRKDPKKGQCRGREKCTLGSRSWSSGATGLMTRRQVIQRIPVKNCKGAIYYGVGFQLNNKIPLYTVYKFPGPPKFVGPNKESFTTFPCTDLDINKKQLDNDWYINTRKNLGSSANYQRGHLTPAADMYLYRDSLKATYYFINAAPFDGLSNNYWGTLEKQLRNLMNKPIKGDNTPGAYRGGWVITGTCYNDAGDYKIPSCFWKIVCTTDDDKDVTTASFIASNTLTNTDAKKIAKRKQIYHPSNVDDLLTDPNNPLGPITPQDLWDEFKIFYPDNKAELDKCANAKKITFPDLNLPPTEKEDDKYALYHFWNDNLFGDGFDKDDDNEVTALRRPTSITGKPSACSKKVVGYVTSWSNVPFTQAAANYLTHAIMAFVEMKADGTLVLGSPDPTHSTNPNLDREQAYARMYELQNAKKASLGRLKTLFAVGGWENSQYFSSVIADDVLIQNFCKSALDILDYFDMDGIDIDFEYPVTGGSHQGAPADRPNYVKFLKTLRTLLVAHAEAKGRKDPYILTIAGAAGAWVLEPGFDLPGIAAEVDWINVMTYDYFGAWDSQWGAYTGPIAPLYFGAPSNYSGKLNVDFTMKKYLCNITDPNKIVMGLGFYGRFWNNSGTPVNASNPLWRKAIPNAAGKFDGGYLPYRTILSQYLGNDAFKKAFDKPTKTPFMYQSATGGFFLAYEDPSSISLKTSYAASKGFAGVMLWAVDLDDDDHTMLRTASSNTLCAPADKQPYKCPPNTGQRWWTLEDNPPTNGGMCGKSAPLFNGFYPVCDPEDSGYGCCSPAGFCGSGPKFCNCTGCVDYYTDPNQIVKEPIKPNGPVRWLTLDKLVSGQPNCGYNATSMLPDGSIPICNPDNDNAPCCSGGSFCGAGAEFCDCADCHNFQKDPNFRYPPKTWIDSGADAGKCGKSAPQVNGHTATCNPLSAKFHCCSNSGYCGDGPEFCTCTGCVDYSKP